MAWAFTQAPGEIADDDREADIEAAQLIKRPISTRRQIHSGAVPPPTPNLLGAMGSDLEDGQRAVK